MPKFVKAVKGFDWGDVGRTAVGLGVIGLGSAIGGGGLGSAITSLISGYIAQGWICKGDFSKKFVFGISILNSIDLLMEGLVPRGVV